MALVVSLMVGAHLSQVCPYPNQTFEAGDGVRYFCVGMASQLYDADDYIAYPRASYGCPDPPPNCINDADSCDTSAKYVAKATGPLCACSFQQTNPDISIGQGTQSILCEGIASGLPPGFDAKNYTTYTIEGKRRYLVDQIEEKAQRYTTNDLSRVLPQSVVLFNSTCPSERPVCTGFWDEGPFFDGTFQRLYGVCQPSLTSTTPLVDPGYYIQAVEDSRVAGECNCRSRQIDWKKQQLDTGTPLKNARDAANRWALSYFLTNREDTAEENACQVTQLGWGWDTAIPGEPELSLMLPKGSSADVHVTEPTGTIDPVTGLPCGEYFPSPPDSISLKDYCKVNPVKEAIFNYSDPSYNVEAAAVANAAQNLCYLASLSEGLVFLGKYNSGARLWDDIAKVAADGGNPIYDVLLLVLIAEFNNPAKQSFFVDFPPSFHGTRDFPSKNEIPDIHIGSQQFTEYVKTSPMVSPFMLAMYHFSTAAVDWGQLVNAMSSGEQWRIPINKSGSVVMGPSPLNMSAASGMNNRFLGLLEPVLGKLTLPGLSSSQSLTCDDPRKTNYCLHNYDPSSNNQVAYPDACNYYHYPASVERLCEMAKASDLRLAQTFATLDFWAVDTTKGFDEMATRVFRISLTEQNWANNLERSLQNDDRVSWNAYRDAIFFTGLIYLPNFNSTTLGFEYYVYWNSDVEVANIADDDFLVFNFLEGSTVSICDEEVEGVELLLQLPNDEITTDAAMDAVINACVVVCAEKPTCHAVNIIPGQVNVTCKSLPRCEDFVTLPDFALENSWQQCRESMVLPNNPKSRYCPSSYLMKHYYNVHTMTQLKCSEDPIMDTTIDGDLVVVTENGQSFLMPPTVVFGPWDLDSSQATDNCERMCHMTESCMAWSLVFFGRNGRRCRLWSSCDKSRMLPEYEMVLEYERPNATGLGFINETTLEVSRIDLIVKSLPLYDMYPFNPDADSMEIESNGVYPLLNNLNGEFANDPLQGFADQLWLVDAAAQYYQILEYAVPTAFQSTLFTSAEQIRSIKIPKIGDADPIQGCQAISNLSNIPDLQVMGGDPTLQHSFMWAPTDVNLWNSLCETVRTPKAGIAVPGYDGLFSELNNASMAYPCQGTNLTFVTFGLDPEASDVVPYTQWKFTSAANAAAAWPDVDTAQFKSGPDRPFLAGGGLFQAGAQRYPTRYSNLLKSDWSDAYGNITLKESIAMMLTEPLFPGVNRSSFNSTGTMWRRPYGCGVFQDQSQLAYSGGASIPVGCADNISNCFQLYFDHSGQGACTEDALFWAKLMLQDSPSFPLIWMDERWRGDFDYNWYTTANAEYIGNIITVLLSLNAIDIPSCFEQVSAINADLANITYAQIGPRALISTVDSAVTDLFDTELHWELAEDYKNLVMHSPVHIMCKDYSLGDDHDIWINKSPNTGDASLLEYEYICTTPPVGPNVNMQLFENNPSGYSDFERLPGEDWQYQFSYKFPEQVDNLTLLLGISVFPSKGQDCNSVGSQITGNCQNYFKWGSNLGFDYTPYGSDTPQTRYVTYTTLGRPDDTAAYMASEAFNPPIVLNNQYPNTPFTCGILYQTPSASQNCPEGLPSSSQQWNLDAQYSGATFASATCTPNKRYRACGQFSSADGGTPPNSTSLLGWFNEYSPAAQRDRKLRYIPDIGYVAGITNMRHAIGGARKQLNARVGPGGNGMCFPDGVNKASLSSTASDSDFDDYYMYRRRTFMRMPDRGVTYLSPDMIAVEQPDPASELKYTPDVSSYGRWAAAWSRFVPVNVEASLQTNQAFLEKWGITSVNGATRHMMQTDPDAVPLFEAAMHRFPVVMRAIIESVSTEKSKFANPFAEWGYTKEQQTQFCNRFSSDPYQCWLHRGCNVSASGTCVMAAAPDCSGPFTEERPCQHPQYPVCVEIKKIAGRYEGMSLNADGSLWLELDMDNASCVQITRKVKATPSNYKQLFKEGLIRNPGCGFNVDSEACSTPPGNFLGPIDSVLSSTNVASQSPWFSYESAFREIVSGNPNIDREPIVWMAERVISATTPEDIGRQLGDNEGFTSKFDPALCQPSDLVDFSGCTNATDALGVVNAWVLRGESPAEDEMAKLAANCKDGVIPVQGFGFEKCAARRALFAIGGTPSPFNCDLASYRTDPNCAVAIDDIREVACGREYAGTWSGTCIKPGLQIVTPNMTQNNSLVIAGTAFKTKGLPVKLECAEYNAPLQSFQLDEVTSLPAGIESVFYNQQWYRYLDRIHYCDMYNSGNGDGDGFAFCEEDPLPPLQRQELCDKYDGPLLVTGLQVGPYEFSDVCSPPTVQENIDTTCYVFVGDSTAGSIRAVFSWWRAASDRLLSPGNLFIKVVPFSKRLVTQMLFRPDVQDVRVTNEPQRPEDAGDPLRQTNVSQDTSHFVRSQGVYTMRDGGAPLCGMRDYTPEAFSMALQDLYAVSQTWPVVPGSPGNRGVPGVDSGSPKQMYDNKVVLTPADFESELTDINVVIDRPGVTIEPAFEGATVRFGATSRCNKLQIGAPRFTLRNAIFDQTGCGDPQHVGVFAAPIVFSSSDVMISTVENVVVKGGDIGIGLLGADTSVFGYSATLDVDNVVISNVVVEGGSGARVVAAFARTTGTPEVYDCPLNDVTTGGYNSTRLVNCMLQIPVNKGTASSSRGGWCNLWAYQMGSSDAGIPSLRHQWYLSPQPSGNSVLVSRATEREMRVNGKRVETVGSIGGARLQIEQIPLGIVDGVLTTVNTTSESPLIYVDSYTNNVHFAGMPFFCFDASYSADTVYFVPCEPCAVGSNRHVPCEDSGTVKQTYNGTGPLCDQHVPGRPASYAGCTACGLENRFDPQSDACHSAAGIRIIQCSSRPYGALAKFDYSMYTATGGAPINATNRTVCPLAFEDGFGAYVDCSDPSRVLAGGYGFNANIKKGVYTNRVLIQPLSGRDSFSIVELGLELLNITEFTGLFAAGLERQVFSPGPDMTWTQGFVAVVLGIGILVVVIVHLGLSYDELNTIQKIREAVEKRDEVPPSYSEVLKT